MPKKVRLYALSTCGWCRKTKRFFEEHHIDYECHDVDLLVGEERERIRDEVSRHNPRCSYPTIVIDDNVVIIGFDEEKIKGALGL